MVKKTTDEIVRRGVKILYEEFGPGETIRFFQALGLNRGNALEEIEALTSKMSRKQALELVRKAGR